jgi:hypothetical protein
VALQQRGSSGPENESIRAGLGRPLLDPDGSSHAMSRRLTAASMTRRAGRALAHARLRTSEQTHHAGVAAVASPRRAVPRPTRRRRRAALSCGSPGRCNSPTLRSRRLVVVPCDSAEPDPADFCFHAGGVCKPRAGGQTVQPPAPWRHACCPARARLIGVGRATAASESGSGSAARRSGVTRANRPKRARRQRRRWLALAQAKQALCCPRARQCHFGASRKSVSSQQVMKSARCMSATLPDVG